MVKIFALVLIILGCMFLYLASPNQKWLTQALPTKLALVAGIFLLIAGLVVWIAALRPLSGIFVMLHVAMVCLFAFPYVATLRGKGRRN